MKMYISKEYTKENPGSVYTSEKKCLAIEGSAISFNSQEIDISTIDRVENGQVVVSEEKKSENFKKKEASRLFENLEKEIYDEMYKVFGTRQDQSAIAYAATWEAMIKRPSNYIDESLGFLTENDVTNFANAKIALADQYGIFRMKKIKQFELDRAGLNDS